MNQCLKGTNYELIMMVKHLLLCLMFSVLIFNLSAQEYSNAIGLKNYELVNHLFSITTVVIDRKQNIPSYSGNTIEKMEPDIIVTNSYYPYGMLMNRPVRSTEYRFGFQGQERDDEVKQESNSINYAYRSYDPRIGRWWSPDPLAGEFPQSSPYLHANNSPIIHLDPDGKKAKVSIIRNEEGGGTIEVTTTVYVAGLDEDIATQFVAMMNQEVQELLKSGSYVDENGQTWTVNLSINYVAGEKGDSREDQYFNNQLTVSDTENFASVNTGEGKITNNTVKKALKGSSDKIGTILEESIHFLGFGDQYDVVVRGAEKKAIGILPKDGFEDDVLTGAVRKSDYIFSDAHYQSLGEYLEGQGILNSNNTTKTTVINERISGGIKEVQEMDLTPEQQAKVIRTF